MKKLIFGLGIMIAGLTCSVASADYYYGGNDCCPPSNNSSPGSDFDGFYIGGNLGVLTNTSFIDDLNGNATGGSRSFSETDFTIGAQLGYDWNYGCGLFGLIVDWDWVNGKEHSRYAEDTLNWFLTIRGRTGITVCDCLFYLTAGAAVIDLDSKITDSTASYTYNRSHWGWVGGIGAEYLLGCNWSIGIDLLSMQFSEKVANIEGAAPLEIGNSNSIYMGRVLLNYRFGDLFCGCF
ncbi:MAG: outer membrane beta-barrel protein [Chlamydiales bacterium]